MAVFLNQGRLMIPSNRPRLSTSLFFVVSSASTWSYSFRLAMNMMACTSSKQ